MRKVIAIHGKMGTGKTTLAENIFKAMVAEGLANGNDSFPGTYESFDGLWRRSSIGDSLKSMIKHLGFPPEKYIDKGTYSPVLNMTYAQALQHFGQKFRDEYGLNFWEICWLVNTEMWYSNTIVDDLRYKHGADQFEMFKWTERIGDLVTVKLKGDTPEDFDTDGRDPNHPSEEEIPDSYFNYILPVRPSMKEVKRFVRDLVEGGFLWRAI